MTIYSDNAGNKFLGDCIYANHNVAYPSTLGLQACPDSDIMNEITALCTASGLRFRNVKSQSLHNSSFYDYTFLAWGANSDTIDDRWIFGCGDNGNTTQEHIAFYNDSGYTLTNNLFSSANRLYRIANTSATNYSPTQNSLTLGFSSDAQWAGVCDGESFALCAYSKNYANNTSAMRLWYGGMLADINTNFNYYNQSNITKQIGFARVGMNFSVSGGSDGYTRGFHYISSSMKELLNTGDAQYAIACSDGQTPTAQWATDMYVFDDNATLGYPAIGRVRNLLLAQGSYTIGKPVRIQGTVQPDNGFNAWLPVGTFAGKVVLMRCYSSVSL